jgi:hypothetical protein
VGGLVRSAILGVATVFGEFNTMSFVRADGGRDGQNPRLYDASTKP